jgi:hypothetical protein
MKTVVTTCGKFYSDDDWGISASEGYGVIWGDEENLEATLREAKYMFPQFSWVIAEVEVKI